MTRHHLRRVNRGNWHQYFLDDQELPGATTILNGGMPKPALLGWTSRTCGEYVVDHWDELAEMPLSKRAYAVSSAPNNRSRTAMARGTRIHVLGQGLVHGVPVDVPDELVGPVEAYARYLERWQVQPLHVESVVAHTERMYGGTLDLVATDVTGRTFLGDIKTGSGVYDDVALQLAAYRYANVLLDDDGNVQPMPQVDHCQVMHVMADTVRVVPVDVTPDTWRAFLYVYQVHRWIKYVRDVSPLGLPQDVPPQPLHLVQP